MAGDLVEVIATPRSVEKLNEPNSNVYRTCVGLKLRIARVDNDDCYVIQLAQEWDHFPDVEPFDLNFERDCLCKVTPFSDAEWASLSNWMHGFPAKCLLYEAS
jgi:hypothetical protein